MASFIDTILHYPFVIFLLIYKHSKFTEKIKTMIYYLNFDWLFTPFYSNTPRMFLPPTKNGLTLRVSHPQTSSWDICIVIFYKLYKNQQLFFFREKIYLHGTNLDRFFFLSREKNFFLPIFKIFPAYKKFFLSIHASS